MAKAKQEKRKGRGWVVISQKDYQARYARAPTAREAAVSIQPDFRAEDGGLATVGVLVVPTSAVKRFDLALVATERDD
jgi:hypothetical protein